MISIIASSAPGLSPLMRGTHMNVGSDRVFTRFIPAGAGNTVLDHFKFTIDSVYPRWRGEHTDCGICSVQILGLSPLARGTQQRVNQIADRGRFIPAGAGNTPPLSTAMHKIGGLSPLARGTRAQVVLRRLHHRFIPAGAGNTDAPIRVVLFNPVYPRWRGEHTGKNRVNRWHRGLSPLARGTLTNPFVYWAA